MAAAISDCDVSLCRGMGWGTYEAMRQYGIRPIVTDIAEIEAAVQAYLVTWMARFLNIDAWSTR